MDDLFQDADSLVAVLPATARLAHPYTYAPPQGMALAQGEWVHVHIAGKQMLGVVWGKGESKLHAPVREVAAKVGLPPMTPQMQNFLERAARYTMTPLGALVKMAAPPPEALSAPTVRTFYLRAPQRVLPPQGGGASRSEAVGGPITVYKPKPAPSLRLRAQRLRGNQTEAEHVLWYYLKGKQMGVKFRRQHPIEPYIVDFACLEKKLIIELDGSQHGYEDKHLYDAQRTQFLESLGWCVLRFWNADIFTKRQEVLETIYATLDEAPPSATRSVATSPLWGEDSHGKDLTPQQQRVLDAASDTTPRSISTLADAAKVSVGVIKNLHKKGLLRAIEIPETAPGSAPDYTKEGANLSPEQRAIADTLAQHIAKKSGHKVFVLDGVTGSGKTEVYFEAVAGALKTGHQILILLPEIALTSAFVERFTRRFGCAPALWHSGMTPAQKGRIWRGITHGEVRVLAGARSALFLPFAHLGLIIVDEEHESAYKQEESTLYHARDMAVLRSAIENVPIILASATPSLETMENIWSGRYAHLRLPERFGGAILPKVKAIDLRAHPPPPGSFLSPQLYNAVKDALTAGEQALLFLNRRGYAPLTLCKACGHRLQCPHCSTWLVTHKIGGGRLLCHHCGYEGLEPEACPACATKGTWTACGPGVERVAEETARTFPGARTLILSSDTIGGAGPLREAIASIERGEIDIIIGTQIVAKGHHFPLLTCVGVVDADLGMIGGELRAAERNFQLLHQVSGRAGRAERPGIVFLQSWAPENPLIRTLIAQDRDGFYRAEAAERRAAHMPPYSRLAALILSGEEENEVEAAARALGARAPGPGSGVEVFGPAPAPLARLRRRWRWRLLARAAKNNVLQPVIADWIVRTHLPSSIRVQVDIDPQNFM